MLYAEYPHLKPFIAKLEREKTDQTPDTLAQTWEIDTAAAKEIAEQLVDVGFFERRGTKDRPHYWVPFLFRDALQMVQGEAKSPVVSAEAGDFADTPGNSVSSS